MSAYDLIIFDWDGTLVDSIDRIVRCFRMSFERLGLPQPEPEAVSRLIGLPLVDSFRLLNPELTDEQDHQLAEMYRDIWRGKELPRSPLFDGVRPMLESLESRGYKMAVATGKSRAGLEFEMDFHDLNHHFPHSRCAGEAPAKPHPGMLREIMELFGAQPQRTLMIGDTTMDLDMAHNAGAVPVAVTTGGYTEEQLMASKPVACLGVVTELPGVL